MLDLKRVREDLQGTINRLETRGGDFSYLNKITELDEQRKNIILEVEQLKSNRNEVSKLIGQYKREKKDASELLAQMNGVGEKVKELDEQLRNIDEEIKNLLLGTPNVPCGTIAVGKDENDNVEIRKFGEPTKFDFEPKHHWDLGEKLGILDFEASAKVAGSRFVYYMGAGAQLERAIYNFYLDQNAKAVYKEVLPPYMVNSASMFGTGQFPKFKETKAGFEIADSDLTMIPTAEVPLVNYYRDEVMDADKLPVKFTALSPAFRSEAGSAGRDTRGLIRLHQFNKVEMVQFTKPEQSWDALESITAHAEDLLKMLGIPYHVITLTTSDMSFTAAMTHDIEVWMPAQGRYREISSCSNTTDFQARRAHIQYRDENGKLQYVHTLNGSGLAVGRTVAAILENFQNEDGSINIPEVLQPYMGGKTKIEKED